MDKEKIMRIEQLLQSCHSSLSEIHSLLSEESESEWENVKVETKKKMKEMIGDTISLKEKISKVDFTTLSERLRKYGITPNLSGFNYILDSIEIIKKSSCKPSMTKDVYPVVYSKYNSGAVSGSSRVERAIRHAIEVATQKQSKAFVEDFGNENKPTNSQFLYEVAFKY